MCVCNNSDVYSVHCIVLNAMHLTLCEKYIINFDNISDINVWQVS